MESLNIHCDKPWPAPSGTDCPGPVQRWPVLAAAQKPAWGKAGHVRAVPNRPGLILSRSVTIIITHVCVL